MTQELGLLYTRRQSKYLEYVIRLKSLFVFCLFFSSALQAQIENPIVFVTQIPKPEDFANIVSPFGNHRGSLSSAPRGGALWIRYPNGTLKNVTEAAGFGGSGFLTDNAIAVRDPSVSWDGTKVIFSMVTGAPSKQYQQKQYRFQLYEVTGLLETDTPVISRVPNQPSNYNNVMPTYGTDGAVLFVSDRPRNGASHLYPQLDEYESTPTNTGLWKLDPSEGTLDLLDHAPSGDFDPLVDQAGRILFTRWDHLQRDQQNEGGDYGAYNVDSESAQAGSTGNASEQFPEPRTDGAAAASGSNGHQFNLFFPWMMNEDGTGIETLNHVGRHELKAYFRPTFFGDGGLEEFFGGAEDSINSFRVENLFHLSLDAREPGVFLATNGPEFFTHSSGQIVELTGRAGEGGHQVAVRSITHPSTSAASDSPSPAHSGLYRDPLLLQSGQVVAAHTGETRTDLNLGSRSSPQSRYDYRIRLLSQSGEYWVPGAYLTHGLSASISYYDPDVLVTYNGPVWELQPVELMARAKPQKVTGSLPVIEQAVFAEQGVSISAFQDYLKQNSLALVISRDVTTRDQNDRQQPFNLRVPGGVASSGSSGKEYLVHSLQLYQADQIRRYSNYANGARVLATPLHDSAVPGGVLDGNVEGAVAVSSDGSVAALVPADRAMTWQLVSPDGDPVVRERFWVTFQAGEVRVCGSCHGVNTADQEGREAPDNAPLALSKLLAWWKGGMLDQPSLSILVKGHVSGRVRAGRRLRVVISQNGASSDAEFELRATVSGESCSRALGRFRVTGGDRLRLRVRAPKLRGRVPVVLEAFRDDFRIGKEKFFVRGRLRGRKTSRTARRLCTRLQRLQETGL